MPSAAGVAAGASLPPLPPTAQRTYDGALSSLLSPLHQASAPATIQAASLRRTRTPSDLREYLARIGLPHDLPGAHCRNVVHVTGTKGKGSTAALAEGVLRGRDGLRTGLFTSPHLVDVRERIRIDGRPLSREAFGRAYWEVRGRLQGWETRGAEVDAGGAASEVEGLPVLPGYFRMLVLMATFVFAHHVGGDGRRIDAVVLEVGMGGRYDATNLFDHIPGTNTVCGVTLIDLDHTRVLGTTREQIAWEKGGIFSAVKAEVMDGPGSGGDGGQASSGNMTARPASRQPRERGPEEEEEEEEEEEGRDGENGGGRFFTIDSNPPEVLAVLRSCAAREGHGERLGIVGLGDRIRPGCPIGLSGDHQRLNAELAVALCDALVARMEVAGGQAAARGEGDGVEDEDAARLPLERALGGAFWPGRCQTVALPWGRRTNLRCDGAHTRHSLAVCLDWFREVSGYNNNDGGRGGGDPAERTERVLLFHCGHERNPVPLLDLIQSSGETPRTRGGEGAAPLFHRVFFCRPDSERPSAQRKASAAELLAEAGVAPLVPSLGRNGADKPTPDPGTGTGTWQDTLASVWRELALRRGRRCEEVSVVANLSVGNALARLQSSSSQSGPPVEVCATGSLYLVGSALAAVGWSEEEAGGHLDYETRVSI